MEYIGDCKEENKIASAQVIPIICEINFSLLSIETTESINILLI